MQRKYKFKLVTFIMLLSLLPTINFNGFSSESKKGNVKINSLEKMLSSQGVSAATNSQSVSPSSTTFNGKSVSQPTRPNLPSKGITEAISPTSFGYHSSIGGLTGVTAGQVTVIKNGVSVWNNPGLTDSNVQSALNYMYKNPSLTDDWVLFIGGALTLSNSVNNELSGFTLASLSGKVKSLTVVGNTTDNIESSNNSAATGNYTINTPKDVYLGCPTIFRNITVNATDDNFYAQGNSFALTNGSSFLGGPNIYGGTDGSSDVKSGGTNIYLGAYGTGSWSVYGGNKAGGTVSGDTHVSISGFNGGTIRTLSGGNAAGGTIIGNTNLSVTDMKGTITYIYGGGFGTSTNPISVTGDVINNLVSTNSSTTYSNSIWGGAYYGNVSGSIYNTFGGLGTYSGANVFTGGSYQGNIGTAGLTNNSISTSYDSSKFSGTTSSYFVGGNSPGSIGEIGSAKGIIRGNITNYIKSGFNTGQIYGVEGGSTGTQAILSTGALGIPGNNAGNISTWNSIDKNIVDSKAQSISTASIYGDIYTWEQSGIMSRGGSDGYSRAGGRSGYVKGNTVLELGTVNADGSCGGSGLVTSSLTSGAPGTQIYDYSNKPSTRYGYQSGWDIVGTGGQESSDYYFQTGDGYIIHNNDISRWTYGGGFGGSQVGNDYNILNGGIVDTLEAGPYDSNAVWGNVTAQVNSGQVDWFLGGTWSGNYIAGNGSVYVYNGTINSLTGGSYGNGSMIAGNTDVEVYGGDFSGSPTPGEAGSAGPKALCGASMTASSSVYGNSTLNVDLTGPTGNTFVPLPSGSYLSGGANYGTTGSTVGTTGNNNEITLKIKTVPGINSLNNAICYGDGASNANSTNVARININIEADGSNLNSVYATNYVAMPASGQRYNTNIKIGDGTTISGTITSGGSSDNLTDAIAAANNNKSAITLGNSTSHNPITINGSLINFNSAEITEKAVVNVAGSFKNGGGATAANHAATYSKHGSIQMDTDSTLGITSTSSVVSASQLVAYPNATLSTPYVQTSGLINLSDLDLSTNKGNLFWKPIGNPPTSISNTYNGAYWGTQAAFPILTFNGGDTSTKSGAVNISPNNFSGVDSAKNYAFLGDYTMSSLSTPSNPTWIGYVVPGQVRVYNTTGDADSGNWQHHLKSNVTTGNPVAGQTMQAWASVASDTDASSIKVMYVMGYSDSTTAPFSFTAKAPYYIKSRTATAFDGKVLNNYPSTNPNFDVNAGTTGATRNFGTRDYFVGNQQDGTNDQAIYGSYIVQNVATDNTTSLSAGNYILPNKGSAINASSLTQAQLQKIVGLKGVGVMTDITMSGDPLSSINNAGNTIQDPTTSDTNVKDKSYAEIPVSWTLGKSSTNSNIVVVPQAAVISSDSQTALNVYDTGMTNGEANNLKNQKDLDSNWTYALAFKADGTIEEPVISSPSNLVTTLQTITSDNPVVDGNGNIGPVTYTYNGLSKNIKINIFFGGVTLSTPTAYDFGTLEVSPKPLISWADSNEKHNNDIIVTDTRTGLGLKPWTVSAAQTQDLKGLTNNNNLASYLFLKDSTGSKVITSDALQIYANTSPTTGTFKLNQNWNSTSGEGIQLNIPVDHQEKGTYEGELTWSLNNVPSN